MTKATAELAQKYRLPNELVDLIDQRILRLFDEDESKQTLEFDVPAARSEDMAGRTTTFSVVWIHPDYNAQFCHYYTEHPGDLPNFYVLEDTSDLGDELLEIDTVPDLVDWLRSAATHSL